MRLRSVVLSVFLIPLVYPFAAHAQQPAFPWRFKEVCTLDTGVPEALVGDMGAATIDGSGRVSFLCRNSHIIYRFDSVGRWLGNIDRKGNGPGEFQLPFSITASFEGDLLIYDGETMRVTHLSRDGEYIASFNLNNLEIERVLGLEIAFAEFNCYWVSHDPFRAARRGSPERVIALVDREGRVIWTQIYHASAVDITVYPPSEPNSSIRFPNPAVRDVKWTVDSKGSAWIVSADCMQLTVVGNDGKIAREVSLQLPELALSRRDWRAYLDDIRPEGPFPSETSREISELRYKAFDGLRDELPPLQKVLWAGPEGILIDRYGEFRGQEKEWRQFTAILPDGRMTQDSDELDVKLTTFSNGYALCVLSEWGELPHIVVYRIIPR